MNSKPERIIVASMNTKNMKPWSKPESKQQLRLKKPVAYLSVAALCLCAGGFLLTRLPEQSKNVLSVMSTGFEYDETLGRLQYVSNILPESAMVFLSSETIRQDFLEPSSGEILHAWTQHEPWLEYHPAGNIKVCENGTVMTIVENRANEYTVRVLHDHGYESIYSGLTQLSIHENESIEAGSILGSADQTAAFELRKDGVSILPTFSAAGEAD